jgi:hypothetical protein
MGKYPGKHPRQGTRTQADEVEYDENLRRENTVKTEVILHLRKALKDSLNNSSILATELTASTTALSQALASLAVYRGQFAVDAKKRAERGEMCAPYCTEHAWHDEDGWHRTDEPRTSLALAE